jgi:hypothetical protein
MLGFLFRNKESRLDYKGHVGRLRAFGALRDLELNVLSLLQGFKAFHLDRGVMHKDISATITGNESKTFFVIEPLNFSNRHQLSVRL